MRKDEMIRDKSILCISPHTDDVELSMGATLSKLDRSNTIHHLALSLASGASEFEFTNSLGILGVDGYIETFEVRNFPEVRQKILETFMEYRENICPDVVFMPTFCTSHQDHEVVVSEGFRVFKQTTIFGYEEPWNQREFNASFYVEVEEEDVEAKIRMINKYTSQKHRPYFEENFIRSWLKFRGLQVGKKYAECFDVIRMIA